MPPSSANGGSTPHTGDQSYSNIPKEPILHNCLVDDVPRDITVHVDPRNDRLVQGRTQSPTNQNGNGCPPDDRKCMEANEILDRLHRLPVKSHMQLAKTAYGVRVLAKHLDSATVKLPMRSIMVITKARDNALVYLTKDITEWILHTRDDAVVYVDWHLEKSKRFDADSILAETHQAEDRLRYWDVKLIQDHPGICDFVITLGGDGTVLYASTLFQSVVPPTLAFALGSLGFLTHFQFEDYKEILTQARDEGVSTLLRMRFSCRVHDARGKLICEQQVLNELTVDRGPSPWVTMLELYGDGSLITVAQADGLIVATPTGSTAYSLSAGGSLLHPSVNGMCITPICPHTLSFRPILLPDSMTLRIKVPDRARATAWASFDGRRRVELLKGYYVTVSASPFPFPTIRSSKNEYFQSVSSVLNWNQREEQRSFVHLMSDKNKNAYESAHRRDAVQQATDGEANYEIDYNDEEELRNSMSDQELQDIQGPVAVHQATFTVGSSRASSTTSNSNNTKR